MMIIVALLGALLIGLGVSGSRVRRRDLIDIFAIAIGVVFMAIAWFS